MTPELDWRRLCEEHQQVVARFVDDVGRLDETGWERRPAPDKWCPGQIAEHLVLTYEALLRELGGGVGLRRRTSWWRTFVIRRRFLSMILREGRLPAARAVREIRPGATPRPREAVVADLREGAARLDEELTRAQASGGRRLTHPFLGRLPPRDALRFVAVHTEHHRRQIPGSA